MKGIVYRIYPREKMKQDFEKQFGNCRYVYNECLYTKKLMYSEYKVSLDKGYLKKHVKMLKEMYSWLKESNQATLGYVVENLMTAYERFFEGISGYPQFKKKKSKTSFCTPEEYQINLTKSTVHIPKFGSCEIVLHKDILEEANKETIKFTTNKKGHKILNQEYNRSFLHAMTIKKTSSGKYFACICVGYKDEVLPEPKPFDLNSLTGIDLGITDYVTLSTGEKIKNPTWFENSLKRKKCLNRRLSKKKGKTNKEKTRVKLAKLEEKIKNQRNDWQHKISLKLVRENQALAAETLGIQDMLQNSGHIRSRHIQDTGWYGFISKIKYKAEKFGTSFFQIGRYEPSTQLCHVCGFKNIELKGNTSIRKWTCPKCDSHHDRDINAAINIKQIAYHDYLNSITPTERREEPGDLLTRVSDSLTNVKVSLKVVRRMNQEAIESLAQW